MQIPISFVITKYDLTPDRYEEALNDGVDASDHEPMIANLGYGTYMRRNELMWFMESYNDWMMNEIFILEEGEFYNNRIGLAGRKFAVAHKEEV